jgi:hypothetical protein
VLHVRHEGRSENQVDRTLAKHLIGDVNVAALGITCDRLHGRPKNRGDFQAEIRKAPYSSTCSLELEHSYVAIARHKSLVSPTLRQRLCGGRPRKRAEALDLTIPPTPSAVANEVIE